MNLQERADSYRVARAWWAHGQEPAFIADVEALCSDCGREITPETLEEACRVCVDSLKFGYPAEYLLAELIEPEDKGMGVFSDAADLMKRYRTAFAEYRKRTDE